MPAKVIGHTELPTLREKIMEAYRKRKAAERKKVKRRKSRKKK